MKMTPKQRVIAAMEHKPVDRIPVFPVVTSYLTSRVLGKKFKEMVLDPQLTYDGLRAMHNKFKFDGFEVGMGPSKDTPLRNTKTIDGITYLLNPTTNQPTARLDEDDAPVPLNNTPVIEKKSYLDKISIIPAEWYIKAGCAEPVRMLVTAIGEEAFIAGKASCQTMNSLVAWRGSQQAMIDLYEDPIFVHEVMARATAISIEVGKAQINAGVDGIYIGDAWASASIISPKMYEEFCLPYHRNAAEVFQALGAKVYLHICGNCLPIIEMMAETGVDAIEPLDVDGGVDLVEVKKKVGGKVCLKGGVSTLRLLNGTPQEVYKEAKNCIEILGPTGYILGSADDIPRDAPFVNILAIMKATNDTFW